MNLIAPLPKEREFLSAEKIGIGYNVFSTLLTLVLYGRLAHPDAMLREHFVILAATFALIYLYEKLPCRLTLFVRVAFQMGLLSYWYPETYEFNRLFPNLDHLFAQAEFALFGMQPAQHFQPSCPHYWLCEAFNLGYFAYYPMILTVVLLYFFTKTRETDRVSFVILGSFFLYYAIYIFVPVAGPQFYFPLLSEAQIDGGLYPAVNDYFALHPQLLPGASSQGGVFSSLVEMSQGAGERPTAAFPSSHVGISTIVMMLAYRRSRLCFALLLPLYLLLCGATVYIQAHYLIDVFAGLATALLFYRITDGCYRRCFADNRLFADC